MAEREMLSARKGNNGSSGFVWPFGSESQLDCQSLWEGEGTTELSHFLPVLRKSLFVYPACSLFKSLANNFGLWPPLTSSVINLFRLEWFSLITFCECWIHPELQPGEGHKPPWSRGLWYGNVQLQKHLQGPLRWGELERGSQKFLRSLRMEISQKPSPSETPKCTWISSGILPNC